MRRVLSFFKSGWTSFGVGVLMLLMAGSSAAFAEHTRVTHPNSLNLEFLGRTLSGSINYDRVLTDDLSAGFGFGRALNKDDREAARILGIYVNYYFTRDAGSPYVTAGADVILNSSDVEGFESRTSGLVYPENSVLPIVGLGYEVRQDAGFLFRGALYGIAGEEFKPWFGFTLGLAF